MMPTLLGGVVLSYTAIDNMLEGPLRIFLKDYIDLKEFGVDSEAPDLFNTDTCLLYTSPSPRD